MPISHHFHDCKAPLARASHVKWRYTKYLGFLALAFWPFCKRYTIAIPFCLHARIFSCLIKSYTMLNYSQYSLITIHICNIADSVQRVFFKMADSVTSADEHKHRRVVDSSPKTLSWTEGVAESLSCVSDGGYPPPTVAIHTDSVDITDQFSVSYSAALHGMRGLRVITYTSERYALAYTVIT